MQYKRLAEATLDQLAEALSKTGEARTADGIEVLFMALSHLLTASSPDSANALINETIERLNNLRPYLVDAYHCDVCEETAEVADHVSQKIGRVSNEAFVEGVSRVLRIFLDSVRDDDLSEDLEDRVEDNLLLDSGEDAVGPTFH